MKVKEEREMIEMNKSLTDEEKRYLAQFGVTEGKIDKSILEAAYKKAWETRDFEIDKLWTRAAYFWGFIAAIFAGYIAVITGEHNEKAVAMHLDLYLILLGIIFSFAWLLVIKGSNRWQRNSEAHIDYLEDFVSGPFYKTCWYAKKKNGKKVSYPGALIVEINKVLGRVVIGVWVLLLIQYFFDHGLPLVRYFLKKTIWCPIILEIVKDIVDCAALIATGICIRNLCKGSNDKGDVPIVETFKCNEHGEFIQRERGAL
ncbi:MAG: hypothetical protein MdMp014T_2000 [Treponematales bacterium]